MKLKMGKIHTEASADFDNAEFDIGNKAVIMDILRGRMYSNPIRAICQEIMCNARDAHREVKQGNKPIHIIFPTSLEPTFIIRDFGPGISPERMREIFVMYGNSTKRSTNRFTGGFGLGSKTPFAYSDTFTVTTITPFDGGMMKRTYVAYIDDSRLGTMSLVEEGITDEPQGTSIIVTVKDGDHNEFKTYVRRTAKYWRIKPRIINDEIDWPEFLHRDMGDGWVLHKEMRGEPSSPVAIVDGIPYEIKLDNVYKDESSNLDYLRLRIPFKTGEIDLTANREAIDYSKKSIKKLKERLDKAKNELQARHQAKFTAATTLHEAYCIWDDIPSDIRNVIDPMWNGISVKKDTGFGFSYDEKKYVRITDYQLQHGELKRSNRCEWDYSLKLRKHSRIIENDASKRGTIGARVFKYLQETQGVDGVSVVTFLPEESGSNGSTMTTFPARDKANQHHWDKWGVLKLSSLPMPPKDTDGSDGPSKPARLKELVLSGAKSGERYMWDKVGDDDEEMLENGKGLYVILKGRNADLGTTHMWSPTEINTVSNHIKRPIYGVFKAFAKKVGPGWKRVTADFIHKKIEAFRKTRAVRARLKYGEISGFSLICKPEFLKLVDPSSPAHKYVSYALRTHRGRDEIYNRFRGLCRMVDEDYSTPQITIEDEFFTRYHMLRVIDGAYGSDKRKLSLKEIAIYVKAMDAEIEAEKARKEEEARKAEEERKAEEAKRAEESKEGEPNEVCEPHSDAELPDCHVRQGSPGDDHEEGGSTESP